MTDGLTTTVFVPRTLETILSQIETDQRADIDPGLETSAESVIGMLNAIQATKLRELWELLAMVYAARDPSGATYSSLDAACALTGTTRHPASKGTVALSLTLAANTTAPAGSIAGVSGSTTNRWVTQSDAVNATGSPATVIVPALAQYAGRIVANAGSITSIVTPLSGWTSVTNVSDAAPGSEIETDAELRLRRDLELAHAGGSSLDAMRTTLLELKSSLGNLIFSRVFVDENSSAYPDALGRPPHSIEVISQFGPGIGDPGAEALALQTIWQTKPGGISLCGSGSDTIVDSQGIVRTVYHSSPTTRQVLGTIEVTTDPATYAGDTALKAAWAAFGATLGMGDDVVRMQLARYLLENVPGLLDIPSFVIGLGTAVEQASNISIGPREIAALGTGNLTVVNP